MSTLFHIASLPIRVVDVIDILLVGLLIHQVHRLARGTIAGKIFLGLLSIYLIYWIARTARMQLLATLLSQFMGVSTLAVVILFQYEIRKLLSLLGTALALGSRQLLASHVWPKKKHESASNITAIVEAARTLGEHNTGALIVLSNYADLEFYTESGDLLGGVVSKRLLLAIFHKQSPLHDGAAIIYQDKIVAVRCILPVTEQQKLSTQFGLRHRAAMGMSELTDTLVLVVSEETSQISVARRGTLQHNLSAKALRAAINDYLHRY